MTRDVKKYAEMGMKKVKGNTDLNSSELEQLYGIINDYNGVNGAIWEIITTAFYFGVEVGSRHEKYLAKKH